LAERKSGMNQLPSRLDGNFLTKLHAVGLAQQVQE
jgi:hypothetical protein